uniref:Nucleotidyltransferase domain-containing protein n=1 Tax=Geobacter metallireducens TaxID=28232 RepID=A0A831XM50_GEOME
MGALSDNIEIVKMFLAGERKVRFAYLFGSVAAGTSGPLSDLDIAVYLDGRVDAFAFRLKLMGRLAGVLKSEAFDLVVLNRAPLLLGYEVVKNGVVLKEERARRVMYETAILQQYLDTAYLRNVQHQYMQEQIKGDTYFG